jgi:hypothetical protein
MVKLLRACQASWDVSDGSLPRSLLGTLPREAEVAQDNIYVSDGYSNFIATAILASTAPRLRSKATSRNPALLGVATGLKRRPSPHIPLPA